MFKQWLRYILAYVLWTLNLLIGIAVILISEHFFLVFLGVVYVGKNIQRGAQVGFFDRMYLIGLGLAWLIIMIVMEDDFKKSVKKGTLLRRFTRIAGPEFLLIFLSTFGLLIIQDLSQTAWLQWLLLLIELGLAAVCVWYTRSHQKSEPDKIEGSHSH